VLASARAEDSPTLEVAFLVEAGVIRPDTVLATTVHPLQVVDEPLAETIHDFRVDLIVTPDETIWCTEPYRPPGILWEHLQQDKLAEVPVLAAPGSPALRHQGNRLNAPSRYNFLYSPQGRPCGRPPPAAVSRRQ
jgi:hypothetical protein